ncbi:MAG: Generic methyltransferase [Candidatus Curtissbacteria bacterium GW2011_GWA1_41_11]|uniref:Generic methyltransferase n=1 Tax=Candidatus Curtissbacteria bacterium GW2011_GWA1_41_11 TaxID=1618409 RepID=A0A0G0UH45_9BACT|nr:MAG: Generic methyltransferase [Candidatus Curtissbacteria bacterium GW2011_GWA1_41_11]
MNTFTKNYFLKYYGNSDKKNSNQKLESYYEEIINVSPVARSKIKILDIGCGYGTFLKMLEDKKGFETYGLDTGSFAISKARKKANQTKFWVKPLSKFQLKHRFQIITAFDVLEHIPNLDGAINQIYTHLVKRGAFLCVVPVYDNVFGRIGGLLDKDETHVHKKSRDFWITKLRRKFEILNVTGILRTSLPFGGYLHIKSKYLAKYGQAIFISMLKNK